MSLIEQGRSFLEALKQGLDAGSKTEVPNVPPEVEEMSSWELLLESKLANTKQKKNKKVKRDNMNASLIMKSPVEKQRTNASESETSKTSRSINKRESTPRTKRPAINASLRSIVKELPPVAIAVHLANLGNN